MQNKKTEIEWIDYTFMLIAIDVKMLFCCESKCMCHLSENSWDGTDR